MNLISIIVPVYNVKKYLPRCLDSLLAQTYRELEIILVDDGSTDGSGDICDQYADRDSRIMIIHQDNGGVSSARNAALDAMTGNYVAFVDADDWLELNWTELAIKELRQADADCYIGGFVRSYDDGRPDVMTHRSSKAMDLTPIECLREMYLQPIMDAGFDWCVWGKLFKTDFWKRIRFDIGVTMEEDGLAFWQILAQCNKVIYRPECGYHYLDRDDSAVNTMKLRYYHDSLVVNKYFAKTVHDFDDQELSNVIYNRYLMSRLSALIMLSGQLEYMKDWVAEKEWLNHQGLLVMPSVWQADGLKGLLKWLLAMLPHSVLVTVSKLIAQKKGLIISNIQMSPTGGVNHNFVHYQRIAPYRNIEYGVAFSEINLEVAA